MRILTLDSRSSICMGPDQDFKKALSILLTRIVWTLVLYSFFTVQGETIHLLMPMYCEYIYTSENALANIAVYNESLFSDDKSCL